MMRTHKPGKRMNALLNADIVTPAHDISVIGRIASPLDPPEPWPDDETMAQWIHASRGLPARIARDMRRELHEVNDYIGARPHLVAVLMREAAAVKTDQDFFIRNGVANGDPDAIRLSMAREKLQLDIAAAGQRGVGGAAGAVTPIDFTREVESVKDMTDAEIEACFRRSAMQWKPEDGGPCPCCGRVMEVVTP